MTIITDGYENDSQEYSGRDIKELVSELKGKGWVFAYIGTNQDVDAVADDMGIHSRMCYDYSPSGVECMFDEECCCKRRFFDRISSQGRSFLMEEEYDYFNSNGTDSEKPVDSTDTTSNTEELIKSKKSS